MAYKGDSGAAFSGGSGQMAVIAELLHRKCNAAVPHIDVGMDVFAFRDELEEVARIQVKTAPGKHYAKKAGFHADFRIPIKQLKRTDSPPMFYALAVRIGDGWSAFLVVSRTILKELWDGGLGYENKKSGALELHIQFLPNELVGEEETQTEKGITVKCGTKDLTAHLNNWTCLPPLKSSAPIEAGELPASESQVEIEKCKADPL